MGSGRVPAAAVCIAALAIAGCGGPPVGRQLEPTRGVVLITLGNVGAAHLGAYGSTRPTSPFFDRLAARGVLFERAISQSPSTLISNVSLLSGLYPAQHGVRSPSHAPSPRIETLPERFSSYGYRTAGFTEGGLVGRHWGFHRGFDEFADPPAGGDGDGDGDRAVDRTFGRGLDFLRTLAPGNRFLLYLHTASAAAPYEPPTPFDRRFPVSADPGTAFAASPADLRAIDRGFLAPPAAADRLAAAYDAGLSYLDGVLESFFAELDRLGLTAETTVIVTSDHGEEFLQHGRLGHFQVYPEIIHVPLLVLHPDLAGGRRVADLVQLIDVAPTLYELADLPPIDRIGGHSLVPLLAGGERDPSWAYAEIAAGRHQRTLLRRSHGTTHQLVSTAVASERDGTWVTRAAGLELATGDELSAVAYHRPRALRLRLDGEELAPITLGTHWTPLELVLPPGRARYRLDLEADSCDSPRALGRSSDARCLSFKLRGAEVRLLELFDLDADPAAIRDVAAKALPLRDELVARLANLEWSVVEPAANRPPTEDVAETLRRLGYLD